MTGTIEEINLHRFSADEYYRLGELGILDKRTELLEGIIIDIEPISPFRASVGDRLAELFIQAAASRYLARLRCPVDLGPRSLPQPDLVLCQPGRYRDRHPGPADIFLVIEISDTSLSYDLDQKLPLYKAAGIQEYWIIDLGVQCVHRFCGPYYEYQSFAESISPLSWPDITIDLEELFS
jgi:Uma2 family endonuclease